MGSILQAKCSCGFTSKEMHVGCGEMSAHAYVPVACSNCKNMWVKNMSKKIHPCNKCGSDLLFYNDLSLEGIKSPKMKYRCPSCGKIEMEFEMHGLWD